MPRLLIAASGTGGHIYPALAFADSLSSNWEIEWLGVPNRLEIELVPEKFHLTTLKVGGLQGNIYRKIYGFLKLFFSSIQVFNLLRRKQINVVFTTGGYISAPTIIASLDISSASNAQSHQLLLALVALDFQNLLQLLKCHFQS